MCIHPPPFVHTPYTINNIVQPAIKGCRQLKRGGEKWRQPYLLVVVYFLFLFKLQKQKCACIHVAEPNLAGSDIEARANRGMCKCSNLPMFCILPYSILYLKIDAKKRTAIFQIWLGNGQRRYRNGTTNARAKLPHVVHISVQHYAFFFVDGLLSMNIQIKYLKWYSITVCPLEY